MVALATQLFAAAAQYVGESLGWTATNALRADLTLHCLRLDLGFHKTRTPGELVERIDGDVSALAGFLSRFVVTLIGNAVLLIGVMLMLWREDWRAGAALTVFAAAAVAVLLGLRTVAVARWRSQREVSAQMFGFFEERLAATEDIRTSGAVRHVMRGQVQRTAAARAFIRRPEVLVIDDLSSALDVETERLLLERLLGIRSAPRSSRCRIAVPR